MAIVLFTARVLNGARANLRAAQHVRDAAVDIGGYHFECGVRDFAIWSRIVGAEIRLELAGTNLSRAAVDLADAYVRMPERASELAREVAKASQADPKEISDSLNPFLKISKTPLLAFPGGTDLPKPGDSTSARELTIPPDLLQIEKWQFVMWYRRANNILARSRGDEPPFQSEIPDGSEVETRFVHESERTAFLAWYKAESHLFDDRFGIGSADKLLREIRLTARIDLEGESKKAFAAALNGYDEPHEHKTDSRQTGLNKRTHIPKDSLISEAKKGNFRPWIPFLTIWVAPALVIGFLALHAGVSWKYLVVCAGCGMLQVAGHRTPFPGNRFAILEVPPVFLAPGMFMLVEFLALGSIITEIAIGIILYSWWVGLFVWIPVTFLTSIVFTRNPGPPFFLGLLTTISGVVLLMVG